MLSLFLGGRGADAVPRHDPHYENRLDKLLTSKDRWRGVHVGQTVMELLDAEMGCLDPESYYLNGALSAANSVIMGKGFYQSMPLHQAAEAHQSVVSALEARLEQGLSGGNGESPQARLRWAAVYVALTGKGHWDKTEADVLRAEIAPRIRRGIDASDEKNSMVVAALAPRFRLVFEEELWRTTKEGNRVVDVAWAALDKRVDAALHRPAGLSGGAGAAPYSSLLAGIRVMEAVEIQRTPDDPGRGVHIIDPPFTS